MEEEQPVGRQRAVCEVAKLDGEVLLRDDKHPDGPVLRFTHAEWAAFIQGIKERRSGLIGS